MSLHISKLFRNKKFYLLGLACYCKAKFASVHAFSSSLPEGLDHLPQQLVDLLLTVTKVTTLDKVVGLLSPAAGGGVELHRPQEVGGVLEVGADGHDLVDEVLHADQAVLAQVLLDNVVAAQGGTLSVHLGESPLVDQFPHRLEVGGSPGDVGLADPQHVRCGLVELDEDSVVDLTEPEELEHLLDLGGHLVDTADTDDKGQLGLGGHVEVALLLSLPLQ